MWFLFVGPRVCIRLPSDSASRRTPLPFANSSYCQACSGLSPPSYRPCWAHNKKKTRIFILIFSIRVATSCSHKGKPFTTIGAKKLNFCVRHGYRCILLAIATTLFDYLSKCCSLKTGFEENYCTVPSFYFTILVKSSID